MRFSKTAIGFMLSLCCAMAVAAQQPAEQRSALADSAVAVDARGGNALEARLSTTVLNGSQDSPVTNTRMVIKNTSSNFYTYVTGWATFYDAGGVRCGEGLFKLDALAPNESAEADTPGLRLVCSPTSWRIAANNLLTRTSDAAKSAEPVATAPEVVAEKPAPVNFIISIDGEEHPIQVNNPIVLKLGNRNRRIIVRPAQ